MQGSAPAALPIYNLGGQTLREVVRISVGGGRFRLKFSNEKGPTALRIGAVHVALQSPDGIMLPGSDRVVRFGGQPQYTLAGGASSLSDPVELGVPSLSSVVVSIYFIAPSSNPSFHAVGSATALLAPGDQTGAPELSGSRPLRARAVLEAIDTEGEADRPAIIAIGDSITDGVHSTPDTNHRWPDLLADRLQHAHMAFGVADAGIASNQLLRDGVGPSGISRFQNDVLAAPGVRDAIVLEGINDIGIASARGRPLPSADDLITGYRQMIGQAHGKGVRVIVGTLLPYKGAKYWSPEGERVRQAVNRWIRTAGQADGVADFDRVMADPADSATLRPAFDSQDHLHPNDQGYAAMAQSIPLAAFR